MLAIRSGIPPSVWLAEEEEYLATAFDLLLEEAEED